MMQPVKRKRGYTRLSAKNQVTIPASVVVTLDLQPGTVLRVEQRDSEIVLVPEESATTRRRRALERLSGSMTGVYEPGYLKRLRDEWG
jgi:AbrB family looped-hinge helix DNA binding protein